ncbi:MAG: hypothetical protein M5U34_33040 [Chloroflexi bacterium]|nr:hypothetical protein [Chloroflexota bacterium]
MGTQRMPEAEGAALIRVVGVGGGGGNALNRMIEENIIGVDFITINTDQQALQSNLAPHKNAVGERTTCASVPAATRKWGSGAAEESEDEPHTLLQGSDMVFITAGMGGGTGTGATPTVARVARKEGALTIGVVTRPFTLKAPIVPALPKRGSKR